MIEDKLRIAYAESKFCYIEELVKEIVCRQCTAEIIEAIDKVDFEWNSATDSLTVTYPLSIEKSVSHFVEYMDCVLVDFELDWDDEQLLIRHDTAEGMN